MSLTDTGNGLSAADVAAVVGNGNNGFGFGNDGSGLFWLLVLFLFGFGNNGWGNGGGNDMYPWINQSNQINDGFRDQMMNSTINSIQGSVTSGFGDLQTALCGGFAGVTQAVTSGFQQAEIANNARQMADMNQNFANQTTVLQGFTNLQSQLAQCCCDNRLATCQTQNLISNESAATRLAIQNGIQTITDKMCQQELDAYKRENENLRTQLNMQNLAASQNAQTAQLIADNTAQTQYIVNRVAPYPIPSYTVPNPFGTATTTAGA